MDPMGINLYMDSDVEPFYFPVQVFWKTHIESYLGEDFPTLARTHQNVHKNTYNPLCIYGC